MAQAPGKNQTDHGRGHGGRDQGVAARRAAAALLRGVFIDKRLLSEMPMPRLPDPAETARAQRLAVTTLRWADRADRLLGRYLRKLPPPEAMVLLRLGTMEICVEGAAGHGVVNAMVTLAQSSQKTRHFKGLINATLRKVADEGGNIWPGLPPPLLPKWLRKPLIADYGKAGVVAMEAVYAGVPPLDLTAKDGDAQALAAATGGVVLPMGSVRLARFGQVTKIPGYDTGNWWVQDVAATLPVKILDPKPGEMVLDLCAAPGGKTMQLAAAGAQVTAVDISEKRLVRLRENLDRCGLSANVEVGDALTHAGEYDAVLLDAPCSATGTIRRHPDLLRAKDGGDFPALFDLQEAMIDHALTLLKPGGRLVFCTCSLLPDEGEIQITDALARHKGLSVVRPVVRPVVGADAPWITPEMQSPEGGLRLRPDFGPDGGMDGFYIAVLRQEPAR